METPVEHKSGSREPVTVIGLGPMGTALADALLRRGHPTTVWNRSAHKAEPLVARGAVQAATVSGALAANTLVILCLADYESIQGQLETAPAALKGRVLVNLSSGTPQQARELAAWAAEQGADYLDGAIMVPPVAIGRPDAVFFYSGMEAVFEAWKPALSSLGGRPTYLGDEPSLAVLYNTALLGMMWAAVDGFLHGTALVGTAGVQAQAFAEVAIKWFLPAVIGEIASGLAGEIDRGDYPGEAGTLTMNLTAMEHLVHTSRDQGVSTDVPEFIRSLTERAVAAGHGGSGFSSLIEIIRQPSS